MPTTPFLFLQGAFGSDSCLGPLDENDPDVEEEADEAELMEVDQEEGGEADELAAALAKVKISGHHYIH